MVFARLQCNRSQVRCVKKHPWCDPCYTLRGRREEEDEEYGRAGLGGASDGWDRRNAEDDGGEREEGAEFQTRPRGEAQGDGGEHGGIGEDGESRGEHDHGGSV